MILFVDREYTKYNQSVLRPLRETIRIDFNNSQNLYIYINDWYSLVFLFPTKYIYMIGQQRCAWCCGSQTAVVV